MSERVGWSQKPLSEVGELIRGRRFTKNDYVETGLGCIHYAHTFTATAGRRFYQYGETYLNRSPLCFFNIRNSFLCTGHHRDIIF